MNKKVYMFGKWKIFILFFAVSILLKISTEKNLTQQQILVHAETNFMHLLAHFIIDSEFMLVAPDFSFFLLALLLNGMGSSFSYRHIRTMWVWSCILLIFHDAFLLTIIMKIYPRCVTKLSGLYLNIFTRNSTMWVVGSVFMLGCS